MRLSFKLLPSGGGSDLVTGALIVGGIALIAVSLVAAATLLAPATVVAPSAVETTSPAPAPTVGSGPPVGLSTDQVATVLLVDASTGAGSAARAGDHVDVLGYFARQLIGSESVTRMLLQDVLVVAVDRTRPGMALTLAVPSDGALLLQEAQAIGARPFVTLHSVGAGSVGDEVPRSFSDTDLADRLAGMR